MAPKAISHIAIFAIALATGVMNYPAGAADRIPAMSLVAVAVAAVGTRENIAPTSPIAQDDLPNLHGVSTKSAREKFRIRTIQQALKTLGFDPGPIDGIVGAKTRKAIQLFQRRRNLPITGEIDQALVEKLDAIWQQRSNSKLFPGDIGIATTYLRSKFAGSPLFFTFKRGVMAHGGPKLIGMAPNQLAIVELIGWPDRLSHASLVLAVTGSTSRDVNQKKAIYSYAFVTYGFPEWTGAFDWVKDNITRIKDLEKVTETRFGKTMSISLVRELGFLIISIAPAS